MISMNIKGMDTTEGRLKDLPAAARKVVLEATAKELLGNSQRGLASYPPVTSQAYKRTFNLMNSWGINGNANKQIISNNTEYGIFVPRWTEYGWKGWGERASAGIDAAMAKGREALSRYLAARK